MSFIFSPQITDTDVFSQHRHSYKRVILVITTHIDPDAGEPWISDKPERLPVKAVSTCQLWNLL